MKKKLLTVLTILILAPVCLAIIAYLALAYHYRGKFLSGISINNVYAAEKTPDEVDEILKGRYLENEDLTLKDKYDKEYKIPLSDIDFEYVYIDQLNAIGDTQNPLLWGVNAISENSVSIDIKPTGKYNKQKLEDALNEMDLLKNQADPKNLRVEIVKGKDGYELIDDTDNLLNKDKTIEVIEKTLDEGDIFVDLVDSDCYEEIEYTQEMRDTLTLWHKLEKFTDFKITTRFYNDDEVIDGKVMYDLIARDGNKIAVDEFGNPYFDEEAIKTYVEKMANKYDSVGGPWYFQPTKGGMIKIEKGTYGYKLNQNKEIEELTGALEAHETITRSPNYSQKGWGDSTGDIGSTYIEVDISDQHLYYYVGGKLVLDSDVVTGNPNRGNGTPERVCYVYYKQRNRTLIGPDYQSFVSYWMAVYNNIGIHDASWRGKYGGEIYKSAGSHGCINTPRAKVSELYDMVEIGTPVVIHQ